MCVGKISMTDKRKGWGEGGVSKEREDIGKNFGAKQNQTNIVREVIEYWKLNDNYKLIEKKYFSWKIFQINL